LIYKKGETSRTLRGGSFGSGAVGLHAAFRFYDRPDYRHDFIGFRCAQDP
jgi:formylglycine-generating enzyme required for sulfatase activity